MCIGSAIQIALVVAPVLVLASWVIGYPMNLVFGSPLDLFAIASAAFIVRVIASDGETTWFEGLLLVGVYLLFALAYYFEGPVRSQAHAPGESELQQKSSSPTGDREFAFSLQWRVQQTRNHNPALILSSAIVSCCQYPFLFTVLDLGMRIPSHRAPDAPKPVRRTADSGRADRCGTVGAGDQR
jgi:hypothetical protein